MTPKIVTRLANIAAKLAGSDKYDPTIEPVTAFEFYLDKGVDKILAIKGVPAVEAGDAGKVLTATRNGAVWQGLISVTATLTTESNGTWSGATWDMVKDNIQRGKIIKVTIATTGATLYALFTAIGTNNDFEVTTSYPMLMGGKQYKTISVYSNGEFAIG